MEKCNRCNGEKITINFDYEFHNLFTCLECNYVTKKKIEECCRNPDEIVVVEHIHLKNLIRLYKQCLNCGGTFKTKPLSQKIFSKEIRAEFSSTNFDNWNENRFLESKELSNWILINNSNTSNYKKYIDYFKSDQWKDKRNSILIRDKNLCQECKLKSAEEVHHKTYENLYNEKLEDLISLCKTCHTEIHRLLNSENMKYLKTQIEVNRKGNS